MEDLSLYILTFNCARSLIDIDVFAEHLFDVLPRSGSQSFSAPELIVLSLQEIAPIAYSFLGGSYLAPYFDAFTKTVKKATAKQWDESYVGLVQDHIGMTGLMVFARANIAHRVSWIDTARVGVGFQEMGNKGAVGARLGYVVDDHTANTLDLTFVAAHLAPMEDGLEQRNLDWRSIVERLVFSNQEFPSIRRGGDADESTALLDGHRSSDTDPNRSHLFVPNGYLFLAGDLNYRTSSTAPSKADVVRFPRRGVPREDPSHYSHLLKEDQLVREMHEGRAFHGLTEAPIDFPPTYKYSEAARRQGMDIDADWHWSSHRWPSWCDRILYLDNPSLAGDSGRVRAHVYDALPLLPHSDHRPVALAASVPLVHNRDPSGAEHMDANGETAVPFAIDPSWRYRRDVARRKEIVVGVLAYLGLTWEGNGMLLASTLGIVGAWVVLQTMWEVSK